MASASLGNVEVRKFLLYITSKKSQKQRKK
jgi:hypothetical protein